jgi:hypothetical protein
VLKHCAANRKRQLSVLPNVGPHIYDIKISGFTRSSIYIYIYAISRIRVKIQSPYLAGVKYLWVNVLPVTTAKL